MSVSLEWLGQEIRRLQADVRSLREEQRLIHLRLDGLVDRIAQQEARFDSRLDQLVVLLEAIAERVGVGRAE